MIGVAVPAYFDNARTGLTVINYFVQSPEINLLRRLFVPKHSAALV